MAHGDGNYFADDATLDRLEGEGLVALRYATPAGEVTPEANRNGSARAIAGILSPNLRVLGLMPHPEDLVDPLMGGTDGKPLFDALARRRDRSVTQGQPGSSPASSASAPRNTPACWPSWAARRR